MRAVVSAQDARVHSLVVFLDDAPLPVGELCQRFVSEGCWIRPMGRAVYLTPPYVISDAELERLCRAVRRCVGV